MHEFSLMNNLINKIKIIAEEEKAKRVLLVKVKLGVFSHISPEHFQEHFIQASQGTIAEGARLVIESVSNINDPLVQEIILDSLDIE